MSEMDEEKIEEFINRLDTVFSVYEIQFENGNIYFFGIPKENYETVKNLENFFSENGYQLSIKYELGEHVIMLSPIKPKSDNIMINIILAIATFFTTMTVGSFFFGADPFINPYDIIKGLPFTIAIMTVLGSHEAGHYFVAKKYGMKTSLPYFIPFPSLIGTMGAIIKHHGRIPNRKALFDVGVSGPLIGLFVSVIVIIVGLLQPPVNIVSNGELQVELALPPLFEFITYFIPINENAPLHPVAFAGWVGLLVTALNLIPTGQLDGGHILRAMIGEKSSIISQIFPIFLMSLGFYVSYFLNSDGFIWLFWGLILFLFAASGHPKPLNDEIKLDNRRKILGIIMFILGILCISIVPIRIVGGGV